MDEIRYLLYIFYEKDILCKFQCKGDDMDKLYEEYGKDLIVDGLKKNMNLKDIIQISKNFLKRIYKLKNECYKVRASDYMICLSCVMALYKLNEYPLNDIILLKKKNLLKV